VIALFHSAAFEFVNAVSFLQESGRLIAPCGAQALIDVSLTTP
jgi:hypothetical protein